MKLHEITVDVYASGGDVQPRYRVYIDNDLLTERDFVWPAHEIYVEEHIQVRLMPGKHSVRIEQVGTNGKIHAKNVVVDGVASKADFTTVE
jgi:hypothetical protein